MKHLHISLIAYTGAALLVLGAGCAQKSADTNAPSQNQVAAPGPKQGYLFPMTYQPGGITPKEVTVNVGDRVEFRNSDVQTSHWPASNPHPTHSDYPEFDAKKNLAPGDVWSFTFTKTGDWKFHDHLHARDARFNGVVHVK